MASKHNPRFREFVKEESSKEWYTLRWIAKKRTEETWETCDKSTVKNIIESSQALEEAIKTYWVHPWEVIWWWIWPNWASIQFKKSTDKTTYEEYKESIRELIKKHKFRKIKIPSVKVKEPRMCKVTISDAHVWLEPNPWDKWLFWYEYNAEIYNNWLKKVLQSIIKEYNTYWPFEVLMLQDLWDSLDWRSWKTTRWWHKLDQNMSNTEAFKTYVRGKVELIENIIKKKIAKKIVIRDVVNDNHAWDFAEIASFTISEIIWAIYWNKIEFQVVTKLMDHYQYWVHTFITTHGKDSVNMSRPMPLNLDHKTENFIRKYITHYCINTPHIHVEKWDQHRLWYNKTDIFDYRNYCAFAPWSNWSQANFWTSYWWYAIDIVPKNSGEISHTDYFLEYRKSI